VRTWRIHRRVERACALWMKSALTPVIPKYPFDVSLEVLSCHFTCGVAPVNVDGSVCCMLAFIFLFFFSFLKITTWPFWLLVFQLQSKFIWFLIFNFGSFIEVLFMWNPRTNYTKKGGIYNKLNLYNTEIM
jgi:energy-coupling factor transporter transmembrane protein EcfT